MKKLLFLTFVLIISSAMEHEKRLLIERARRGEKYYFRKDYFLPFVTSDNPNTVINKIYATIYAVSYCASLKEEKTNRFSFLSTLPSDLHNELVHFVVGSQHKELNQVSHYDSYKKYSIKNTDHLLHLFKGIPIKMPELFEESQGFIEPWIIILQKQHDDNARLAPFQLLYAAEHIKNEKWKRVIIIHNSTLEYEPYLNIWETVKAFMHLQIAFDANNYMHILRPTGIHSYTLEELTRHKPILFELEKDIAGPVKMPWYKKIIAIIRHKF